MKFDKFKIFYVKNKSKLKNCVPSFYNDGILFFKITTSEGIYGLSEPSPYLGINKFVIKKLEQFYIKYLKGKLLSEIDFFSLRKKIRKNSLEFNLIPSFEQSTYDLKSKIEKKNITYFLNNNLKKNKIKLYASGGMLFENKSYDILIEEALRYKEQGYMGWKFRPKVPVSNLNHQQRIKNPPDFDLDKLLFFSEKIRKKVGDDFNLMLDCGCRLKNIKKSIKLLDALNELNFLFIEEPFKRKISNYVNFNKKYKTNIIAGGESFNDYKSFLDFSKVKNVKYIQPDTNLLTFQDLSKIKNIKKKISIHNWCNKINFSMNLNFALTIKSDDVILEHNIIKSPYNHLFDASFRIKKGYAYLKKNFFGFGRLNQNYKKNLSIYEKEI